MTQCLAPSRVPSCLRRAGGTRIRQKWSSAQACGLCNHKDTARVRGIPRVTVDPCSRDVVCQSRKQNADADQEEQESEFLTVSSISPQARVGISLVQAYKGLISPLLPSVCRFLPSCSTYSVEAFEQYGASKGVILMAWRIMRCNPFRGGFQGQYDPPQWPPVGLELVFRQ